MKDTQAIVDSYHAGKIDVLECVTLLVGPAKEETQDGKRRDSTERLQPNAQ